MKIKTFYAKTMAEALREVKSELGHDALLLSTKEIPSRSGSGSGVSGYEIVAAVESPEDPEMAAADTHSQDRAGESRFQSPPHPGEIELKKSPEKAAVYTRATIRQSAAKIPARTARHKVPAVRRGHRKNQGLPAARTAPAPALEAAFADSASAGLFSELVAGGVQEWLARKLLTDAQKYLAPKQRRTRATLFQSVVHAAERMITPPPSGDGTPVKRVIVFLGPTGVGKTTSIAKLAARLALQQRKKVVLMTLDGYRIGAVEQLRTYAGLMGIPFRFVSDVADLPKAIREHGQRDYILIDTAGRGPRDLETMKGLAEFLKTASQVERHLVLSATTKASDLKDIVDRYEICCPDHLLFTKLDETTSLGPILNELVRSRKALSYYSDGQRVPEDLHAAPNEQIVNMVLNRL
jgi:flagellar biosynthesis protein FlhF